MLRIQNFSAAVGDRTVVHDFSLTIHPGEIHALMGPNGSGKSSLAYAIAGHPEYRVTRGNVRLGDTDLLALKPEERAQAGLFLSFQEPPEVGGVSMRTFLTQIKNSKKNSEVEPHYKNIEIPIESSLKNLRLEQPFLSRFLNEGFSGGEKKKSELLQFLARKPKVAIFDEIDSGLDLDSLAATAQILNDAARRGAGILVISHTSRLLERLSPTKVHVLVSGRVVVSGGSEVLQALESQGYGAFVGEP